MERPEPLAPTPDDGHRLHVLTLVQRVLKSLPALVLATLPLLARRSADGGNAFFLGFFVLYGAVALPLMLVQYLRFRYWITPREIVIHSGVFTRRKRNIPLERIQNIEVERSLLPRLLGTAKVKIETAGSTTTEGVLEYVTVAEAERIRQVVRSFQRRATTEPAAAPAPGAPAASVAAPALVSPPAAEEEDRRLLATMPARRVWLSGMFRFSLLYIALIFSAMQYLFDVFGLDPDELAFRIARAMRGGLPPYAEAVQASPWFFGIAVALAAALLGWLTGVLVNVNRYHGFRLWRVGDKLQKRHGLLTLTDRTIPLKKVQALLWRSNPLMRRFGWYRLELQTMGYDVGQQGHQVAVPFAKRDEILALAPQIRPFALPEVFTPVSRLTIRRRLIRYSVVWLGALAPLAYFFPVALWGLLALPLLGYLAVLQYRHHGYAFAGGLLYVRRGVFRQHLWILPVERFQVFYAEATYFQRRLGLASVYVDTAGAGTFSTPEIDDVEAGTAGTLVQELYRHFQEHFGVRHPADPAG